MSKQPTNLALVDDHKLFRKGMRSLIEMVSDSYHIVFEADNGREMQTALRDAPLPEIILMDITMPGMDGFTSVRWLNQHYPDIKVLVVSMVEKEESIIHMLKLGVKGYLSKDVEPAVLGEALEAIKDRGFYYTDFITGRLVHSLQKNAADKDPETVPKLSEQEREFIRYACTEMTYQEIADQMFRSAKTVDSYRTALFDILGVKNRTGLLLYALRNGLAVL